MACNGIRLDTINDNNRVITLATNNSRYRKLPSICKTKKKQSQEDDKDTTMFGKKFREHSPRSRRFKEPLPLRQRALPQSFWQQPSCPKTGSRLALPATTVLPPLFTNDTNDDLSKTRPVTPPEERNRPNPAKDQQITYANPELLFRLFDNADGQKKKEIPTKRGRPSRKSRLMFAPENKEDDPYLCERLPVLSATEIASTSNRSILSLARMEVNNATFVDLPAIKEEINYSAMLSDMVARM